MSDLYWKDLDDKGNFKGLYCGLLDAELASIDKRAKFWHAVIWLPGIEPAKTFAPYEEQVADVMKRVEHWFNMAATFRPATDDWSGE
jgi:hypothetical protein